jgi:hypothetical protein
MSWVATAVVVKKVIDAPGIAQRKAARDARKDAERDRLEAIRAENFAEEIGKGQGELGRVRLALDEELDTELSSGISSKL